MSKIKKLLAVIFIIGVALIAAHTSLAAVDTGLAKVDSSIKLGAKSPVEIVTTVINFFLGFLSLAAICLILWAGFLWMTSGGNEDRVSQAKKILKNAIIGLVIILSAWGIVYYVMTQLLDVTGNQNSSTYCTDGSRISCGCGGEQVCSGNSWGSCLGSTCQPPINPNSSCDGNSSLGSCQADDDLCGPDYLCNTDSCVCEERKGLGQSCDATPGGSCQADNNLCGPYLKCDTGSCLCAGPPVITGISPLGGFCNNDENRACNKDGDCLSSGICNLSTPNGATNNFLTIYGYNFNSALKSNEQLVLKNDFDQAAVGSLASNWQVKAGNGAKSSISSAVARSDKNSLLIHQDKDQVLPGKCGQLQCSSISSCTWNAVSKTCSFVNKDECKKIAPAVYNEGESLCSPNLNSSMRLELSYDATPLNLEIGKTYSIQFYYKGKSASNLSLSFGDKQCLGYDSAEALKSAYSWNGSTLTPSLKSGEDACNSSYGAACSEESNTCCANAPYQKKCYAAQSMTPIYSGTYADWSLYSYNFQYTPEMETWVNKSGQKSVKFIISSPFQNTNDGTDLYIDDFSIVRISESGKLIFLGKNAVDQQVANYPKTINPSCISSWTDRQIIVAVPNGAVNGPIKVERENDSAANIDQTDDLVGPKLPDFVKNNISRPGLCAISPTRGLLGDKVIYQGVNLRNTEAYFGDYSNPYKGINSNFLDNNLLGQTLAPSIMPGKVTTFVEGGAAGVNQKSNALLFIKDIDPEMGPYIASFNPTSGPAGQYITVTGRGFGNTRGSRQVFFGDKQAVYDFPEVCTNSVWRDDQIVVKVPEGLSASSYQIKINLGTDVLTSDLLSPSTFKYDSSISLKTGICKLDPTLGQVGTTVNLWGEYFGSAGTNASVVFNSDKSTSSLIMKDGKADKLEAVVPINSVSGPVYILKNGEWGNHVNFSIGKCATDKECGSSNPVCCQGNTYKVGTCASSITSCYFDVPNSVYETSFNTGYNTNASTTFESCSGMASYFGSCQTGQFCPNSAGKCSPYSPQVTVGATCGSTFECGKILYCVLNPNNCSYDKAKDTCVANSCQLSKTMDYSLVDNDGKASSFKGLLSCKEYKNKDGVSSLVKHLSVTTSCPAGWVKTVDGTCASSIPCQNCATGLDCKDDSSGDDLGKCESAEICPSSAYCGQNPNNLNQYACLDSEKKTCDCCCEIGKDSQCCAPLKCAGTCGSDQSDDGAGLGSCSGCASVGTTVSEHDAACNCSTSSGKFCQIDAKNTQGICVDCAALDQEGCSLHSDKCCFDASKKTCQGGNGSLIPGGFCAYYDCDASDKTKCDINPASSGQFLATSTCGTSCLADPRDVCDKAGSDALACSKIDKCCFDGQTCTLGSGMPAVGGASADSSNSTIKFCARYDCVKGSEDSCKKPSLTGAYIGIQNCLDACENNPNPDASCNSDKAAACDLSVCGGPYKCINSSGADSQNIDCGFCCCKPGTTIEVPNGATTGTTTNKALTCVADKGNCSGGSRGLFCGCQADEECGAPDTQGCGGDTCCHQRPNVINTLPQANANNTFPANEDSNICRNSIMELSFDQVMDTQTFANNILLVEETSDLCPIGTSLLGNNVVSINNNFFARLYQKINFTVKRIFNVSNDAVAATPLASKLYCVNPVTISSAQNFLSNGAASTKVYIRPKKVMSPDTNYFVIVKGDKDLDSNTGVMSDDKVGLKAENSPIKDLQNGITFNKTTFYHSYILSFKTLDSRGPNKGLCTVNSVEVKPYSFLIKTAENNASDDNLSANNFDKENDSDRLLSAYAYSVDKQLLQPVTAYFWNWKWSIENNSIASKIDTSGLSNDKLVVRANEGITDNSTKVTATIDMSNFSTGSCLPSSCSCTDDNCSAKCCNATLEGDTLNNFSTMYVFLCNNPWPVEKNGIWSPWFDISKDKDGKDVINHNYKFYYCRDAGNPGTVDDLPAINDSALIFGSNSNFICSDGGASCAQQGNTCGPNNTGVCVWSVLKESYFFRSALPQTGEISSIIATGISGQVKIDWYSPIASIASYKIYYSPLQGNSSTKVLSINPNTCIKQAAANRQNCSSRIDGLVDGQVYNFRISSLSDSKAESLFVAPMQASSTDKIAPAIPVGVAATSTISTIKITWKANADDAIKYRVYHGVFSGRYHESFDTAGKKISLDFDSASYGTDDQFFAVSALDKNNNESSKSVEVRIRK